MAGLSLQQLLIRAIRAKIPRHSSVEMEMCRVLGLEFLEVLEILSYQRSITLNESKKLTDHFGISLDGLSEMNPSVIPFRFRAMDYNLHSMRDYFHAILAELRNVDGWGPRRLVYAANDFPIFSLFQFPDLAAFKLYFWGRTVYDLPAFRDRKFSLEEIDKENLRLGEQMWRRYLRMPSVEVWSSDIVSNVLKQVFHAWKFGYFVDAAEARHICGQITKMLDHTEQQAAEGRKHHPDNYAPLKENYQLYYNEVSITNNTIFFSSEEGSTTFVLQNALNYLATDNPAFCLRTEAWLHTLLEKSTPISIHNEVLRRNFFDRLRENVDFIENMIK